MHTLRRAYDPIKPVTRKERINSLDALRGLALLGILPANVLLFALYFAAENDPTVAGGAAGGWNLACRALFRILIAGKMRALFSMVFGASAILLTSRAERGAGTPSGYLLPGCLAPRDRPVARVSAVLGRRCIPMRCVR